MQARLEGLDVFEPSAIRFAAAKVGALLQCAAGVGRTEHGSLIKCIRQVASVSGDIRRGLELCIRAVEIAEAEYKCAAQMQHSNSAVQMSTTVGPRMSDEINSSFLMQQTAVAPRRLVHLLCNRLAHGGQAALPGDLRVKVAHTSAAVEETFDSLHMRLMCMAPRLEKLVLAALLLETRFTGNSLQRDSLRRIVHESRADCEII